MTGRATRLNAQRLADLTGERFDLIVIGGGITGAGIARHAAQAGLSTLLLEADDFAAGTSSRSTKLIHGGLRYLAMGDVALVREGALERKSVLRMAPHLTEPRWMLVPARNRLEYWKLRVGISLYERLGAVAPPERHHNWNRAEMARSEPLLDRGLLHWVCAYREYLTDDARLVLATLRAAARDGARLCSRTRVEQAESQPDAVRLRVCDRRDGSIHELTGRAAVNAAGPWVESLLAADGTSPRLHLSKGVHLVLDLARLPIRNMVMMTAADGRPVFAIPRGEVVYVGTTDTTFAGAAALWPDVRADEIDYLLETLNAHFTDVQLGVDDVLSTWAGLRPLVNQPGKAPKEMSRRDEIWRDGRLVSIAGGKLTGFRKMAEQAMDAVAQVLGTTVSMADPLAPLPGGDIEDLAALQQETERRYQLEPGVAARLVRLYGSEVNDVLGDQPRPLAPSVFAEEVDWAVLEEGAESLEDLLYRRLRVVWFLPAQLEALIEPCAERMARLCGWDDARRVREIGELRAQLRHDQAFRSPG
ncbi:MAG: glycerol-3-phosphate dehydrogenase/oxidase [Pseudomonadales bacterium]